MSRKYKSCITTITGKVIPTRKDWILPATRLDIDGIHWYLLEFPNATILLDVDTEQRYRVKRKYDSIMQYGLDGRNLRWAIYRHVKKDLEVYRVVQYYKKDTRENCVILYCREYKDNEKDYPIVFMKPVDEECIHWCYEFRRGDNEQYRQCKIR